MNTNRLEHLIGGMDTTLPSAVKEQLDQTTRQLSRDLETARQAQSTTDLLSGSAAAKRKSGNISGDTEMFTTISEMINGNTRDFAGFGTLLDNLYEKNKRYFSILKDYEIMPILIPQINRVLMFLVNECISPDIQNNNAFTMKYVGSEANATSLQAEIERIKTEMRLDSMLWTVYMNRYKLGHEYYAVEDYQQTFDHMAEQLQAKRMNESTSGLSDMAYFDKIYSGLTQSINEMSCKIPVTTIDESAANASNKKMVTETVIDWSMKDLNIIVERSSVAHMVERAHADLLSESYSSYRASDIMSRGVGVLNEAAGSSVDTSKLEQLVDNLRKKKLQRCTIIRFDPARLFRLKVGGKVIGSLYVSDINDSASNMVNFAQSLKDQLLKSRATNLSLATQTAEEVISKELAKRIIKTFDPNLGINRVEDIDLMHDFIRNNEIYKGNKRVTFYYEDEIFDMSRADDSILTNAVFFTKLYATLMLNNIITKVLRGRGRQIHTVQTGVSGNTQRYIDNAMASLAMPENNLGTLHGSFEQIMNPFNAASDIVIPTEEDGVQYIRTDYIPGQDIDMNDEFLRSLLNSIVSSFGLDSAVLDATNGNLQFARTLTMESLQICISIRNEQQDLLPSWEAMCLRVLEIMGSDRLKDAVKNNQVEVRFYEPKSLIIQNTIDDLNNVKSLAEYIADITPEFNDEGMERARDRFIFDYIASTSNYDFAAVRDLIKEVRIRAVNDSALETKIRELIQSYADNTQEVEYGDENTMGGYGDPTGGGDEMGEDDEMGSYPGAEPEGGEPAEESDDSTALTPEEEALMADGTNEDEDEDEE